MMFIAILTADVQIRSHVTHNSIYSPLQKLHYQSDYLHYSILINSYAGTDPSTIVSFSFLLNSNANTDPKHNYLFAVSDYCFKFAILLNCTTIIFY